HVGLQRRVSVAGEAHRLALAFKVDRDALVIDGALLCVGEAIATQLHVAAHYDAATTHASDLGKQTVTRTAERHLERAGLSAIRWRAFPASRPGEGIGFDRHHSPSRIAASMA